MRPAEFPRIVGCAFLRRRLDLGLILGYGLLALLVTWPAVTLCTTHLAGERLDGWQSLFNLWWMREALGSGSNPYFTPYMYHPEGSSLLLHTLSPLNAVPGALLSLIMDFIPAYNLLQWIHYALGGYAGYRLAHHLSHDRLAAALIGALYTFSPFHLGHGVGHLQLTAVELLPLALLYLLRTLDEPGVRNAVLAGLFTVLSALASWYYLIYLFLLCLIIGSGRLAALKRAALDRALLRRLGVVLAIVLVLLGPLLLGMILQRGAVETVKGHSAWYWAADLQNLLIPGERSAWAGLFGKIPASWSGNWAENTAYPGYLLLAAALFGFFQARSLPYRRTLGAAALVFLAFSLGPHPHWGGEVYKSVPLPYAWFAAILPSGFGTAPMRASYGTHLALCLLAAGGLAAWRSSATRLGPRARVVAVALFGVLALVEHWPAPHPMSRLPVPGFFNKIADEPPDYAMMDMRGFTSQVYGIVRHHKPLVNGHIARDPVGPRKRLHAMPIVRAMMRPPPPGREITVPGGRDQALADLRSLDIRYIVREKKHSSVVEEQYLGLKRVHRGDSVRIYEVPQRLPHSVAGSPEVSIRASSTAPNP